MAVPVFKMATIGLLPSPLKKFYYRMKGAKIGRRVSIGLLSVITSDHLEIGDDTKIGVLCFLKCRKIKLGKRVRINMMTAIETGEMEVGNDSTIMEQVVIGGMLTPRSKITIGKRVKVFPYSFLNPTEPITIEDDVGIGGANYIFTHGSWQSVLDGFPVSFGPVTIKKGVWFPWRVFVMPNVTVGEYATIGAGSIITKDIPGRSLAAGSPAKVLRTEQDYIKQYSVEEKNKMVINILKELVGYMNYLGKKSSIEKESAGELILKMGEFTVRYSDNAKTDFNEDVFISLEKIPDELIEQLNRRNKVWFDLEGKQTHYSRVRSWTEIKDFFSRYGIRFEVNG